MSDKADISISILGARPILIATDFSDDSEAALVWGLKYAALVSAALNPP